MCFGVCTACNLQNNRAAYTHRIRDQGLTAEQITHSGNKLGVCVHVHLQVCVCVWEGCCLPPTHVSNTKPSNCPHDPREEDQPERDRLMDERPS